MAVAASDWGGFVFYSGSIRLSKFHTNLGIDVDVRDTAITHVLAGLIQDYYHSCYSCHLADFGRVSCGSIERQNGSRVCVKEDKEEKRFNCSLNVCRET